MEGLPDGNIADNGEGSLRLGDGGGSVNGDVHVNEVGNGDGNGKDKDKNKGNDDGEVPVPVRGPAGLLKTGIKDTVGKFDVDDDSLRSVVRTIKLQSKLTDDMCL